MSESLPVLPAAGALNVEHAVRERYSGAAQAQAPELCCPVSYDPQYLRALPREIIERDYGCGNPARWLHAGETVLDLGSGGGKICYIAAQVVGAEGRVIGVDCNDEMLALARRHQAAIADRLGYSNVRFHKGRIQDLALDLDEFEQSLALRPVRTSGDWLAALARAEELRQSRPMVPAATVDVALSNCVLNLVQKSDRRQLFQELFRVLRPGGRAVISDIASDEPVPDELQRDPRLWSGCVSGAFVEEEFLAAFVEAGFHGVEILERPRDPWTIVAGIEFRSLTVRAYKPDAGPERDLRQAVVYAGPWRSVEDDAGRIFERGVWTAVGDRTFAQLTAGPYASSILGLEPQTPVAPDEAPPFASAGPTRREPGELKNPDRPSRAASGDDCCGPGGCCS